MLSHWARASRWRQLYQPLGYQPSTFRVLLAIMFGYFMNIFIPRAGEISRCGLLKRTDDIPFEESIGTVVAERAVDLLTILVLVVFAFLVNFELFSGIYNEALAQVPTEDETSQGINPVPWLIFGSIGILAILFLIFRKRIIHTRFYTGFMGFVNKVKVGVASVAKIKNKPLFFFNTITIWAMYFFMSYVVFFSIPATSGLGLSVAMAVLISSGLAMIVPVSGGIGAYHLFISTTLLFFGLTREEGLVFATIMHASQLLLYFVGGGLSFIIASMLKRNTQAQTVG